MLCLFLYFSSFPASKSSNAHLIAEFLYSSANLLQLLNDSILRRAHKIKINASVTIEYLKTLLQVLEYVSVFAELSSKQFATEFGRWIVLALIQATKSIVRLILLLKYKQGLQLSTAILPLDRRAELRQRPPSSDEGENDASNSNFEPVASTSSDTTANNEGANSESVKLKRSGRVMRSLETAPSRGMRTWLPPGADSRIRQYMESRRKDAPPSQLTQNQIYGEILHILRPITHLTTLAIMGPTAWTPYIISLSMDLSSLKLLHEPYDHIWNLNESVELGQRTFSLLLYLLRSPFYDRYTKERIIRILSEMANRIPLIGRLIRPLITYLPEWQQTYFYVWGS